MTRIAVRSAAVAVGEGRPRSRLTVADHAYRALTEADFLRQVLDLARICGWRTAHFRPAWSGRGWRTPVQGDGAGFPDLVLCRRDRLLVAELKRQTAPPPRDEQLLWLRAFDAAGAETAVWRPADFDQIVEALR